MRAFQYFTQHSGTCEFADVDREIKTQIVQSCSSHKLRTKALENPLYTLTQLLDAGKAMELSKTQAANIEDKQSVNKLFTRHGNRSPRKPCLWSNIFQLHLYFRRIAGMAKKCLFTILQLKVGEKILAIEFLSVVVLATTG